MRRRAILAPTVTSRPDLDPEVPLESGEHPSCGKAVGKPTVQKMAREALADHKYRLVVYASSDEEDNDAWAGLECISTTATVEPVAGFTTTQGRKVMLDDYTPVVMHQSSEPDIELELEIRPEDEDFCII